MDLKTLPALFRSRKSQQREDYVRDSLSSLAVTSRLSCFSSSNGLKNDPFSLTFDKEWRHTECKVIKWYNRIAPSTQIASIEHRKTLEAPFFHEFLLIHLTDGAVCRLERMGDGSRVDAVRRLGCTAHDIIQWFPAEQYATSPLALQPSEVVMHVQFPRTFDLLDVLAICYSIKQHRRASIYTLQRYNCYFLCNTILAILTRRVAEWETKLITPETWPKLVDDVLRELPRQKHDDAFDYCGIGVCSLLEPDCPNLVNDVVDLLRSELKSGAHRSVALGMADTLWHKDLQAAVLASLSDNFDTVAKRASGNEDNGVIGLSTLLGRRNNDLYPDTELRNPTIQRMLIEHKMSIISKYETRRALEIYRIFKMKSIEQGGGPSRSMELLTPVFGPFLNWWMIDVNWVRDFPGVGDKLDMRTRTRFELSRISLSLSLGRFGLVARLCDDFDASLGDTSDKGTHTDTLVVYEQCQLTCIDTRSTLLCVLHYHLVRQQWTYSLRCCYARLLMEALFDLANSGVITTLGLAAAQLVEEDIMREMSEIWKSLPEGFGGVKPTEPSQPC